jgi:hypothetical protein
MVMINQVTSTEWIMIISIIIPSLVTFIIGFWQIKVMRELANPIISQQSPDKKLKKKFPRATFIIFGICWPLCSIILAMLPQVPLTKTAIFNISYSFGILFFSLIVLLFGPIIVRLFNNIDKLCNHIGRILGVLEKLSSEVFPDKIQKKKKSRAG